MRHDFVHVGAHCMQLVPFCVFSSLSQPESATDELLKDLRIFHLLSLKNFMLRETTAAEKG